MSIVLSGVLPAVATPFRNGNVATDRLRSNIERFETTSVAGYLILGSTGEAVMLDAAERTRVLEAARAGIPRGKCFLAGVTAESGRSAVGQCREAADLGADLVLVATPHYFREQMTDRAIADHYRAVADGSPLPVLLYNVPKFTGLYIAAEVVAELSRHGNIAGIKDSSGDLDYLRSVRSGVRDGFVALCGAAAIVHDAMSCGASGAILAAAAAIPEPFAGLLSAYGAGDEGRAHALQESVRRVSGTLARHGVPAVKAAMDLRGLAGGDPRPPLQPVSETLRERIRGEIDDLVEGGVLAAREL